MNQSPVENRQSTATLVAMQLAIELEEKLPDVLRVEIEPHRAFEQDELPAVGVFIGEDTVNQLKEVGVTPKIVDNKVVTPQCCNYWYQINYVIYIEVVVAQCDGAYATAERIAHMIRQFAMNSGIEGLFYDGSINQRSEERASSNQYSRSLRFIYQHELPELEE